MDVTREVSLTKRWKKLGNPKRGEWVDLKFPGTPGRVVQKFKGDDIWVRWEPTGGP